MIRTFSTAAAFVAGAALAAAGTCAVSDAVAPVYPEMRERISDLRARGMDIEVVSVGNSHSGAIDLAVLGMTGIHLFDSGQDALESAYLASYAAARSPSLRFVLVNASYGFQALDHRVLTSVDASALRRAIYARTSSVRYIPGDGTLWLSSKAAAIARPDHWQAVVWTLFPAVGERGGVQAAVRPAPPPSAQALVDHAVGRTRLHVEWVAESLRNDPTTTARIVARIEALAEELRRRGVVLVLYTSPYTAAYLERLPTHMVTDTRRALAPLLVHPNVVWMDFGGDPEFARANELFANSDHVNEAGARLFSARLRGCLGMLDSIGAARLPAECRRVLPPSSRRGQ